MKKTDEITELIRSLEEISGVGICFYDTKEFFHYEKTGERRYRGHYCDFCRFARDLPSGRLACDQSDRVEAVQLAAAHANPFFHRCHMGLCELVVPVIRHNALIGLVFIGQCRIEEMSDSLNIRLKAEEKGANKELFSSLYNALPAIKKDVLSAMGRLVNLYFSGFSGGEDFFSERDIDYSKKISDRICAYIEANYFQSLSPGAISKLFYLNLSYISRIFRKEKGMTIGEYIRYTRHKQACRLLENPLLSVNSIALNVGYTDTNYFCRVFKSVEGITPTEYREKQGK